MGGRLVATPHGPAALFMYDDDRGTRLVLLMRPMAVDQDTPMSQHSRGAVTGFAWADKGIGYSLVGPTSNEILHPLADEVRRQIGRAV
jgi:anti-sigma factor RsiW